ncbi:ABC transporter ATP-binding protein [Thauera linaloolentis]|uniref:ABC transporter n=1 Tax=Thauera linaloolentis (strain DSM 12138 / JCM 21573 / CCUG 41526 / CIP 105981 / IAM 15112 / NBRC 102519 / 47Lol) TaxID=1123367 RepID=N6Z196_THAL4|nr:ABC transporter ATP-binding protein [Thauera linaloolentis]ENO85924.1 ABC transporter [Thauera linaloolentis 47Lol = DSM 12138]MCM8567482.1 ABC transporter ATP-binding protein [Thauera linaloolentis]
MSDRTPPPAASGAPPRLQLEGIGKVYPGVVANEGIDLAVRPGEIRAILGENGAGKSTLMKIIYGVTRPSAGRILWEGQAVQVENPAHARSLGIGMVFQHFSLFETLSVAENVALALPGRPALDELSRRIAEVSERYGLPVDPRRRIHALSVGERQRVEIIRCLLQHPRLLILDEPTSVLTPQAVRKLFGTLRQLSAEGCSILYISHKLDEIQALCHTATVLRGGRVSGECIPARETAQSMASLMIGRALPHCEHTAARADGELRLRLAGLSHASDDPFGTDLQDIHLDLHAGEVVGIAGVSGNGQQALLRAISGEDTLAEKFPVQICGVEAGRLGPAQRRRLGLCFVPEERLGRGVVPDLSLADNALLTAAYSQAMVAAGFLRAGRAHRFARRCIEAFGVKCGGSGALAGSLSGGNLQKFIIGREILQAPKVFVCAQPTWGVDVGAAAFIRQSIIDLRDRGCAVLVVSEEVDELFEICDRIAVIAKGRLSPARPAAGATVEEIGVWMSGMWPGAEPATHVEAANA